jgi:uncharacterized protein YjiS (DUF1127 family)
MSSTRPVVRSGQIVQAPALLDLVRALWRRLRPRSQARRRRLATLSDHLLADIGLNGPDNEQPTWQRYIHRH